MAGYEFESGLRVEAELFFARAGLDKLIYSGASVGGNASPIGPYVDAPVWQA